MTASPDPLDQLQQWLSNGQRVALADGDLHLGLKSRPVGIIWRISPIGVICGRSRRMYRGAPWLKPATASHELPAAPRLLEFGVTMKWPGMVGLACVVAFSVGGAGCFMKIDNFRLASASRA